MAAYHTDTKSREAGAGKRVGNAIQYRITQELLHGLEWHFQATFFFHQKKNAEVTFPACPAKTTKIEIKCMEVTIFLPDSCINFDRKEVEVR